MISKTTLLTASLFLALVYSPFSQASEKAVLDSDPSVSLYKKALESAVNNDLGRWDAPSWRELYPLITKQVLEDAFTQAPIVKKLLTSLKLHVISRPQKSIKRVLKKQEGQRPGIGFKVNSDFAAFRVFLKDVNQIDSVIDEIASEVTSRGGKAHIRGKIRDGEGKLNDVVNYIYIYLPEVGYIAEIQVGHEFAAFTFERDSYLRDHPEDRKNLIDLWDNDFYSTVKTAILAKARGETVDVSFLDEISKFNLSKEDSQFVNRLHRIVDEISNSLVDNHQATMPHEIGVNKLDYENVISKIKNGFESQESMKLALGATRYFIISADNNPNYPEDAKQDRKFFDERESELVRDLNALANNTDSKLPILLVHPTDGQYMGQRERSYFCLLAGETDPYRLAEERKLIMELGMKYKQDSIIYAAHGLNFMIYTFGPQTNELYNGQGIKFFHEPPTDNFSTLKVGQEKVYFSLQFNWESSFSDFSTWKNDTLAGTIKWSERWGSFLKYSRETRIPGDDRLRMSQYSISTPDFVQDIRVEGKPQIVFTRGVTNYLGIAREVQEHLRERTGRDAWILNADANFALINAELSERGQEWRFNDGAAGPGTILGENIRRFRLLLEQATMMENPPHIIFSGLGTNPDYFREFLKISEKTHDPIIVRAGIRNLELVETKFPGEVRYARMLMENGWEQDRVDVNMESGDVVTVEQVDGEIYLSK